MAAGHVTKARSCFLYTKEPFTGSLQAKKEANQSSFNLITRWCSNKLG